MPDTRPTAGQPTTPALRGPLAVLTSLFFAWGFITALNDVLIPHLKAAFTLSYLQATMIQFCFFAAYLVVSVPAGLLVERIGYQRGIVVGLAVAAAGCLMFHPAAGAASYGLFLAALFVLAAGITLLQVAANPYVAALGDPATAPARLNLTQAFNSLGTTLAPLFGAALILSAATRSPEQLEAMPAAERAAYAAGQAASVQVPYVGLAVVLLLIALVFAVLRLPAIAGGQAQSANAPARASSAIADEPTWPRIWQARHLVLGAVGIFLYVGAEVSIGSFLVNTLNLPQVAGLREEVAARYLSLYWGGAMVGRFVGAALLAKMPAGRLLAINAAVVIALLALAIMVSGPVAMWALLGIGLFNSIMFPTIFTLAIARLGPLTSEGSGVLCMAIVGGAIVPVVMGFVADHAGLLVAYWVPLACYLFIAWYGARGHVPQAPRTR